MIIYDFTCLVSNEAEKNGSHASWNFCIPAVMTTGLFQSNKLFHLPDQDEATDKTFVVQFFAQNLEDCNEYIRLHPNGIIEEMAARFGSSVLSFGTSWRL